MNGWVVVVLLWQPYSESQLNCCCCFHRDTHLFPNLSVQITSLVLQLLSKQPIAAVLRQVFTLPVFPAPCCWLWLFGESQSSGGLSAIVVGIFNSLLGNMRWSVSGVPPSGSMRGEETWCPRVWKEKDKIRGKKYAEETQQADLCKPFEMLTGWLYLFFFSVQDWTVSLFLVRLLNNPVKKKKDAWSLFGAS